LSKSDDFDNNPQVLVTALTVPAPRS